MNTISFFFFLILYYICSFYIEYIHSNYELETQIIVIYLSQFELLKGFTYSLNRG